ncbi:MAG: gliding motility-associated C-terminal domain-containing protein [Bacteroidota bacterium]
MKIFFVSNIVNTKKSIVGLNSLFFWVFTLLFLLPLSSAFAQNTVPTIDSVKVKKSVLAISCGKVYASGYSGGRNDLYELNGATMVPVFTAPQIIGGLAVSANGNAYYDDGTFFGSPLYSSDGVTQINTGAIVTLYVGEAADDTGNVYYIDNTYHLKENVFGSTGNATDLGALLFDAGDTIGPTLAYGDMTFDGNGRLFWYGSVSGFGPSYLYYIDRTTLKTYNLGHIGPDGATGLAFDGGGKLITTSNAGATVISVDLSLPTLEGVVIGTASPSVFDLGSCATPLFDPDLVTAKSVANVTTGINPATIASQGDVLEYTIVVSNVGNLISNNSLLTDAIPAGTTYVLNSTVLNGNPVADIAGNMPFVASNLINSPTELPGNINVGSTATITFRVTVNSTATGIVSNTASATFPTVSGGITTQTVNTNTVVVVIQSTNAVLNATKAVANVTSGANPASTANSGEILEYTIAVNNSGTGVSNNTLFSDAIPAQTTYVPNSTILNGIAVADISGTMPFAASGLINSPSQLTGVITVGSTAIISFRVTVNSNALGMVSNTATVNYSDNTGAVTTNTNTVVVTIPTDTSEIEIHNYMSPDGDGLNEFFAIDEIENYPDNTVEIYNRWGVLIYDAKGYNNADKSFIGFSNQPLTISKDQLVPAGTYFYVLRYKNQAGKNKEKVGYLFVSR